MLSRFIRIRILIDITDQCAQEYGVGFSATSRRIDQPAFSIDNMCPGLLLERKWPETFRFKPFKNDCISGSVVHVVRIELQCFFN
jgi:hypothetical protein